MKLLLGLVLFSIGCAGVPANLCQVKTPGATFMVHSFGDSITGGAGTSGYTIGNQTSDSDLCLGYQALFTTDIGANDDNQAVSGSTFISINEFTKIMALSGQHQDINTVLPGFNDVTQFGPDADHLSIFEYDLTQALIHLSQNGKMTLVGTTLYATTAMQAVAIPLHTNANVDLYVNTIKQVVNQLQSQGLSNIYLVDTNAIYNPNTMSNNNYHPDNYGHQVLANAFYQAYLANK